MKITTAYQYIVVNSLPSVKNLCLESNCLAQNLLLSSNGQKHSHISTATLSHTKQFIKVVKIISEARHFHSIAASERNSLGALNKIWIRDHFKLIASEGNCRGATLTHLSEEDS